jgi:hypothetical protein
MLVQWNASYGCRAVRLSIRETTCSERRSPWRSAGRNQSWKPIVVPTPKSGEYRNVVVNKYVRLIMCMRFLERRSVPWVGVGLYICARKGLIYTAIDASTNCQFPASAPGLPWRVRRDGKLNLAVSGYNSDVVELCCGDEGERRQWLTEFLSWQSLINNTLGRKNMQGTNIYAYPPESEAQVPCQIATEAWIRVQLAETSSSLFWRQAHPPLSGQTQCSLPASSRGLASNPRTSQRCCPSPSLPISHVLRSKILWS